MKSLVWEWQSRQLYKINITEQLTEYFDVKNSISTEENTFEDTKTLANFVPESSDSNRCTKAVAFSALFG